MLYHARKELDERSYGLHYVFITFSPHDMTCREPNEECEAFRLGRLKKYNMFTENAEKMSVSCCRSKNLARVSALLREQLDSAQADIEKVTSEWQRTREELAKKEADWRREEDVSFIPLT